jgi:hypothetical protein
MILNFREMGPLEKEFSGGKVFVDGREILQAWYVDTSLGIVKTFDVFGESEIRLATESERKTLLASDPTIEGGPNELLSKTISGTVEVFRADEDRDRPLGWVKSLATKGF